MDRTRDLDAVADACLVAHAVIEKNGTPEMRAMIRVLLHILGREIACGILTLDKPDSHAANVNEQFQRMKDDHN